MSQAVSSCFNLSAVAVEEVGARLCTQEELEADEAAGGRETSGNE